MHHPGTRADTHLLRAAANAPGIFAAHLAMHHQGVLTSPEDLFGAKLADYRKEWTDVLAQARAAQSAADAAAGTSAGGGSAFSVELVRS